MKNNIKYLLVICLPLILISFSNCRKDTVNTTVKGIVIDTVKNVPAANQKVIIVSCYAGNFRPICGNLLASTITNAKGEFELNFFAPKNPFGFEIRANFDSTYYYNSSPSENVIPLEINNFILYARKVSYIKLNLKVGNNSLFPFNVSSGLSYHTIDGNSIDTTLYFKVLPNSNTKILYTVWDPSLNNNRRIIDTLKLGLEDTTYHNKLITDTRNMPPN